MDPIGNLPSKPFFFAGDKGAGNEIPNGSYATIFGGGISLNFFGFFLDCHPEISFCEIQLEGFFQKNTPFKSCQSSLNPGEKSGEILLMEHDGRNPAPVDV